MKTRDPLAGTRPAFMPDPREPIDPERRERDLRAILDQPRPVVRARLRRLPAVTVAAGVVVAAVVVATTVSGGPDAGPAASPRQVLLAAAEAAADADAATGRYWHLRTRERSIEAMWPGRNHGAYLVSVRNGSESWISRTGADRSVSVDQIDLTTRALTDRDKAEWDKAGNPAGIPDAAPAPDAPPRPPMPPTVAPTAIWESGELVFTIGGVSTPLGEVLALPTDPVRLKAFLLDRFRAGGVAGDQTEWLTWEADTLISGDVPTTPGTRAAAYPACWSSR
jgi:hypothetical protein